MKHKSNIAIITSFPPGTGIFRFAENIFNFDFYSNLLYFRSIQDNFNLKLNKTLTTINSTIIPDKYAYISSFIFPTIWSRELKKYEYAHIVSPDFFHISRYKKSIIGTVHDLYFLEKGTKLDYSWYYRFFEKLDLNYCTDLLGVTTISKHTEKLLKHFYPNIKTKAIHNWTQDYFIKMNKLTCRQNLSLPDSKFILLNVSYSSSNKNLDFLGELMEMLLR